MKLLTASGPSPLRNILALPPSTRQFIFRSQTQSLRRLSYTPTPRATAATPPSTNTPPPSRPSPEPEPEPEQGQEPGQEEWIPAPREDSGPLMHRSAHRSLPDLPDTLSRRTWLTTLPLFLAAMALSSWAIFNYQKSTSSTVASILYALRTNPTARELLGDEIYFASKVPWIRGELGLGVRGRIDLGFWVRGSRGCGWVEFRARRVGGVWRREGWGLKMEEGGGWVELLQGEQGGQPALAI